MNIQEQLKQLAKERHERKAKNTIKETQHEVNKLNNNDNTIVVDKYDKNIELSNKLKHVGFARQRKKTYHIRYDKAVKLLRYNNNPITKIVFE